MSAGSGLLDLMVRVAKGELTPEEAVRLYLKDKSTEKSTDDGNA